MVHYFFSDPTNISFSVGIGIGYKSIVNLKFVHSLCIKFMQWNIVSFLKLVYQNKNELWGTSMAFMITVSRFKKKT